MDETKAVEPHALAVVQLTPTLCTTRCSSRSITILLAVSMQAWWGGQCSPDCEPEVEKDAVLVEGVQQWVVHTEEEV